MLPAQLQVASVYTLLYSFYMQMEKNAFWNMSINNYRICSKYENTQIKKTQLLQYKQCSCNDVQQCAARPCVKHSDYHHNNYYSFQQNTAPLMALHYIFTACTVFLTVCSGPYWWSWAVSLTVQIEWLKVVAPVLDTNIFHTKVY